MQLTQIHLAELAKACADRLRSPEPFREWLESRPAGEVGKSGTPCGCPIARFLQESGLFPFLLENLPQIRLTISKHLLHLYTPEISTDHHLPRWAVEFVYMADNAGPRSGAISKGDALKFLAHAVGVTS